MKSLSFLPALTRLDLQKNKLNDVGAIPTCNTLRWLNVSHNNLKDISGLSSLHKLQVRTYFHQEGQSFSFYTCLLHLSSAYGLQSLLTELAPIMCILVEYLEISFCSGYCEKMSWAKPNELMCASAFIRKPEKASETSITVCCFRLRCDSLKIQFSNDHSWRVDHNHTITMYSRRSPFAV